MVNFLALEYRDDGEKTGGWVVWNIRNVWNVPDIPNVWNIPFVILLKKFVQSVVFVFFNQNADCLTNCKVYAILIIDARDITFSNGKCWTA